MESWLKEWDNLINKQDCAVDAVKLEWLIKSNQPAPRQKKGLVKAQGIIVKRTQGLNKIIRFFQDDLCPLPPST